MEELFLIYINEVGKTWEDKYIYEFLFSNTIEGVDGTDWDLIPAAGNPEPPRKDLVKKVGKLTSDIRFNLIQDSDTFSVWDAVSYIIAMGWEDISDYDEYPEHRLFFTFGEDIKSVNDKLYNKDIILEFNTKNNDKPKK